MNPEIKFTPITGERSRIYYFPDGGRFTVNRVTGLCVRPTSHRLETAEGRKLIVRGGFYAIEINANEWSA